MSKRFPITLLLVFLLQAAICQEFNDFFSALSKSQVFTGSVAISKPGAAVYHAAFGMSNIERNQKITQQSQFPIASISKTFTAIAMLQLQEKGLLSIHEPVQKYLPDFPYPDVSIRQLLNNTSGMPQYYHLFDSMMKWHPEKTITNQDIIPVLNIDHVPLSFVPGSRWDYNNVNFCIAAMVIEKVSGIGFADYLQRNIFKPAKMKNSFVPKNRKLKTSKQVALYGYANLYTTSFVNTDSLRDPFPIYEKSNFYGNGGIVSTASDLLKYQAALFSYQLLGKKALDEALTATKLNDGKIVSYYIDGKEASYGLGWSMYTDESNGKIVFHDGFITGLTSILLHNINKNQTVVLLSNTGSSAIFPVSNTVLQLLDHQPYTMPVPNLARIYGSTLETENKEKADQLIEAYLKDPASYAITERDFNRLGYEFLRSKKTDHALQTFHAATLVFPNSWNIYDSYGEALLTSGSKDDAVKMYQKSVALNPDNTNGRKVLEDLLK